MCGRHSFSGTVDKKRKGNDFYFTWGLQIGYKTSSWGLRPTVDLWRGMQVFLHSFCSIRSSRQEIQTLDELTKDCCLNNAYLYKPLRN